TDALARIMEVLSDCEMRLRDAASKKILIEVALLKAIEARSAVSLDSVIQQLQNLRSGGASPAPAASSGPATAPAAKARAATAPATHSSSAAAAASPLAVQEAVPASGGPEAGDLPPLWARL